jgi:hypothetical protein
LTRERFLETQVAERLPCPMMAEMSALTEAFDN